MQSFPQGSDPIWMDNVTCTGSESALSDCPHAGYGNHNCYHFEDVPLSCISPALEIVTPSTILVPENRTFVAVLEATADDPVDNDLSWTITGGDDSGEFTLTTVGVLSFKTLNDHGAPDDADTDGDYEVTVQVSSAGAIPAEADLTVTPQAMDGTAPELSSAAVNLATLVLTYSEALDIGSSPASSAFTVSVEGASRVVTGVSVTGNAVSLTLDSAVLPGEAVTVSYTVPSAVAASRTLSISTADDNVVESSSTVTVAISEGSHYAVSASAASAEVEVTDNDTGTLTMSVDPTEVSEGEDATITVAVNGSVNFADDQTVTLALSGTAAATDFQITDGAGQVQSAPYFLTLPAGASSVTAVVTALMDADAESAETIVIAASHGENSIGSATVTGDAAAAIETSVGRAATHRRRFADERLLGPPVVGEGHLHLDRPARLGRGQHVALAGGAFDLRIRAPVVREPLPGVGRAGEPVGVRDACGRRRQRLAHPHRPGDPRQAGRWRVDLRRGVVRHGPVAEARRRVARRVPDRLRARSRGRRVAHRDRLPRRRRRGQRECRGIARQRDARYRPCRAAHAGARAGRVPRPPRRRTGRGTGEAGR